MVSPIVLGSAKNGSCSGDSSLSGVLAGGTLCFDVVDAGEEFAVGRAASILQAFLIFNTVYRLSGITYAEAPSSMLPELHL